jgi:hypothetical protein
VPQTSFTISTSTSCAGDDTDIKITTTIQFMCFKSTYATSKNMRNPNLVLEHQSC